MNNTERAFRTAIASQRRGHYKCAIRLYKKIRKESDYYFASVVNTAMILLQTDPNGISSTEALICECENYLNEGNSFRIGEYLTYARVKIEVLARQNRLNEALDFADQVDRDVHSYGIEGAVDSYANLWHSIAVPFVEKRPDFSLQILNKVNAHYNDIVDVRVKMGIIATRSASYLSKGNYSKAMSGYLELKATAESVSNEEQVYRAIVGINQAKAYLGDRVSIDELFDAYQYALGQNQLENALEKGAILLKEARRSKEWKLHKPLLEEIRKNAIGYDQLSYIRNKVLYAMGLDYKRCYNDESGSLVCLINSAQGYLSTVRNADTIEDKPMILQAGHECFRELAGRLLEMNRNEESCYVMELAKFFGWAFSFSKELEEEIFSKPVFDVTANTVDTRLLSRVISSLKSNECIVYISIVPTSMVGYVCADSGVRVCRIEIDEMIIGELEEVPSKLSNGDGISSIPVKILDLAKKLIEIIGDKEIKKLLPSSPLDIIPWREVFKVVDDNVSVGSMLIGFAGLQPIESVVRRNWDSAVFSNMPQTDIEAELCASELSASVQYGASKALVRKALREKELVFLSCHSKMNSEKTDVLFQLSDGDVMGAQLLSDVCITKLAILSSCESATYYHTQSGEMWGIVPMLLSLGCEYVIASRIPLQKDFSRDFLKEFVSRINKAEIVHAFSATKKKLMDNEEMFYSTWAHSASLEIFSK